MKLLCYISHNWKKTIETHTLHTEERSIPLGLITLIEEAEAVKFRRVIRTCNRCGKRQILMLNMICPVWKEWNTRDTEFVSKTSTLVMNLRS